jgi:uncharacterized protein YkwD
VSHYRSLLRVFPLLAATLIAAGCGGGSSEDDSMDPAIGRGNAEQIRADYAAIQSKSAGSATVQVAAVADQPQPLDGFAQEALAAVNAARAEARKCGDVAYPAVGPLRWEARTAYAALLESEWMLNSNSFGHTWPGGELVWDRLTMSGYRWSKADENIAAGYRSLAEAMKAWIDSPPHCVALMRADVTDVAIAVVPGMEGGAFLSYWTMVLAAPR